MFKAYKKPLLTAIIILGLVGIANPAYASMTAEGGSTKPVQLESKQTNDWSWGKCYFINKFSSKNTVVTETPKEDVTQQETNTSNKDQSTALNAFEEAVFTLTNEERAKYGLPALEIDEALSRVAREKSNDMAKNRYFSHQSPTYGSPFDMMEQFSINYRAAGENIARGQTTPEEVVTGWMNSEGHRENILSNKFTHIGIGFVENGNYWTQQFVGY